MKKNNIILGVTLIIIGLAYLLNLIYDFNFLSIANLWPIILLLIGISLEMKFFRDRSAGGNLVPGGILIVLSIIFTLNNLPFFPYKEYLWPFYSFAVAFGFLQYYFLYKKDNGILLIGLSLLIVFLVSFLSLLLNGIFPWLSIKAVFPLLMIILGVIIIIKK